MASAAALLARGRAAQQALLDTRAVGSADTFVQLWARRPELWRRSRLFVPGAPGLARSEFLALDPAVDDVRPALALQAQVVALRASAFAAAVLDILRRRCSQAGGRWRAFFALRRAQQPARAQRRVSLDQRSALVVSQGRRARRL